MNEAGASGELGAPEFLGEMTMDTEQGTSDCRETVTAIFTELTGPRAIQLSASKMAGGIMSTITDALCEKPATEQEWLFKDQISFNLSDWIADAAFLVALHLYPERFTPEQIRDGVDLLMCDMPDHISNLVQLHGKKRYAIVIEKSVTGFSVYVPDLPGCIAVAENFEEAKCLIQEAIKLHLEGMQKDGIELPEPSTIADHADVDNYLFKRGA